MPIITMPKLSDTMAEGTIASWKKKKGDTIEMGDILAEIETDKATMEMEAFDEGILQELYVAEGGKAPVGGKIALILAEGEKLEPAKAASKAEKAAPGKTAESKEKTVPAAKGGRIKSTPLARKIAAERGVSLEGVAGTGPGDRVVAKDVLAKGAPSPAAPSPQIAPKAAVAGDKTIPLSNMRRAIAERLVASKQQNPHFYLSVEVEAGSLMRLRKELNASHEAAGLPKLTVNDFILLAVGRAAVQHPSINASWGGDSIIQYAGVNISVAVAVDDGLITPVIRNADKLSLKEISAAVKDLPRAPARKNSNPRNTPAAPSPSRILVLTASNNFSPSSTRPRPPSSPSAPS